MTDQLTTVGGIPQRLPLAGLRLDWRNPRLPPDMQDPEATQKDLALYIDKRYNPLEVARSIARHGFFESEPLIAVLEGGVHVVVEGNRRLTALLGLADPDIRSAMAEQTRGWRNIEIQVPLPSEFPVVLVPERKSITPLLGFRHISGIKEWEPYAQARYIADLVEVEGHTLDEVADLVGRPPLEVKAMYRDHEIVRQANEVFELNTDRVTRDFGVFNAAMGIRNIRTYIDAPTPATTRVDVWPLSDDGKNRLKRLFIYIYGDSRGNGRVIPESRMLKDLGRVLADDSGRAESVLRETGSLAEAMEALSDPADLANRRLNQAVSLLRRVNDEGPPELDRTGVALLGQLGALVSEVSARVASREGGGS